MSDYKKKTVLITKKRNMNKINLFEYLFEVIIQRFKFQSMY